MGRSTAIGLLQQAGAFAAFHQHPVGHAGEVGLAHLEADQRGIEVGAGLRIAGQVLGPQETVQGRRGAVGRVAEAAAQQAQRRAVRVEHHGAAADVRQVQRPGHHAASGRSGLLGGAVDVGHRHEAQPLRHRLVGLRATCLADAGDVLPAGLDQRVRRAQRAAFLELPAEQRGIEGLHGVGVLGDQVAPDELAEQRRARQSRSL